MSYPGIKSGVGETGAPDKDNMVHPSFISFNRLSKPIVFSNPHCTTYQYTWVPLNQYNDDIFKFHEESFHSDTNMTGLKSVVK